MPVFNLVQDAVSQGNDELTLVGSTSFGNFYVGDVYDGGWIFSGDNGTDQIPQGATILTATVTVNRASSPDYSAGFQGRWIGALVTSPPAFVEGHSHALTSHFAAYTTTLVTDNNWPNAASHTSPSLVGIIQEIVNQGGWSTGGQIGIIYETTNSAGYWAWADNSATLTVTWSTGSTASTLQTTTKNRRIRRNSNLRR